MTDAILTWLRVGTSWRPATITTATVGVMTILLGIANARVPSPLSGFDGAWTTLLVMGGVLSIVYSCFHKHIPLWAAVVPGFLLWTASAGRAVILWGNETDSARPFLAGLAWLAMGVSWLLLWVFIVIPTHISNRPKIHQSEKD